MYTSVFRHPVKGDYRYSFSQSTLERELQEAAHFDGNPVFGEHLYSRPVHQVCLQADARYRLSFSPALATLRYRDVNESLPGQFDYFRAQGEHGDDVVLLVDVPASVPGLGVRLATRVGLRLSGIRSFKFGDLCRAHVFQIDFTNGNASLLGFRSERAVSPSVRIPLELVNH